MRLAVFKTNGRTGLAAGSGDGFHGRLDDDPSYPGDLDTLIRAGADLVAIGRELASAPAIDLDRVELLPPLSRPSKIICVGVNYADHSREIGFKAPPRPTIFTRFSSSLVGHRAGIARPAASIQLDYEGELVAVIGRRGRNIPRAKALAHVVAYSIFNDASVRDFQLATSQWTMGKNFDATGGFGPWLTTADTPPPGAEGLSIRTRLNGRLVQDANTRDMVFNVADIIAHVSQAMTLEPGDVLVTGTPGGVGMARDPKLWMVPGDVCEVEIEGIGTLINPIVQGV